MPQLTSKVKGRRDLHSDTSPFDKPLETMYKYTSFKRAFDILMENKIYFAKCSEFNDPYDWRVTLDIETPEKRKIFMENMERKYKTSYSIKEKQEFMYDSFKANEFAHAVVKKQQESDTTGFCCLADNYQSLPMWAHYAENHTGCCLMFDFSKHSNQKSPKDDFPFHWMKKIEYPRDLPKYNMSGTWTGYFYKSCEWKYENEWRAIMFDNMSHKLLSPNSCFHKKCNGAGLYPLDDFLCGVILGDKMEDAFKEVIKTVAHKRGISVKQASPGLYKYGMCLTEIDNGR